MLKKILWGIGALVLIFILWSLYGLFIAEPASPPDTVSFGADGLDIRVDYSRPYKKGRLIFGEAADEALQPYGEYWRLGANAATEITFNKDVFFGGESVDAGTYRMYAIPDPDTFEIRLNSETGVFFAAVEPDYSLDVVKVQAPVVVKESITEQFTIAFGTDSTSTLLNFDWDIYSFNIPIRSR